MRAVYTLECLKRFEDEGYANYYASSLPLTSFSGIFKITIRECIADV